MVRAYPLCLAMALASFGCGDVLVIGYECEDGVRNCAKGDMRDAAADGGKAEGGHDDAAADGPTKDGETKDAGEDATADAQPDGPTDAGGFDAFIRNRSFELTDGSPGDLDDPSTTQIEPWSSCPNLFTPLGGLSVTKTGGVLGTLSPTEGKTFLRFSYIVPARFSYLTQALQAPWPAGEMRALTFDVAGQSVFNELTLTVVGSAAECPEANAREVLARAQVPQTGGWTRDVCVEITPTQDAQWVTLHAESAVPTIDLDGGGITAQVFVDNLRESASCP